MKPTARQSSLFDSFISISRDKEFNNRRPSATSTFVSTDNSHSCCSPSGFFKQAITSKLPPLVAYSEIPEYLKDNDFILTGYRSNYSYSQAWLSLFSLHNESMNIWTHFLGFLFTLSLLVYTWSLSLPKQDTILLSLFLILGSYTLLSSSLFHMHICIDARAYHIFGCLDFSGISASLAASSLALTYILYTCSQSWRIPLTVVLIIVNTVGIIGPLVPGWMTPAFRTGRCLIYLLSGLASLIPTIYMLSSASAHFSTPIPSEALFLLLATILQHLVGAIFYTQRLPERLLPGAFDLAFSSHSIFHILVVTASVTLYKALLVLLAWKQTLVCMAV